MNLDWIVAIVVGVVASIPGVYAIFAQRKKVKADTRKILADVATQYEALAGKQAEQIEKLVAKQKQQDNVVEKLQAKIELLEADNSDLRKKLAERDDTISEWQSGISLLIEQLTAKGEAPVWTPKTIGE